MIQSRKKNVKNGRNAFAVYMLPFNMSFECENAIKKYVASFLIKANAMTFEIEQRHYFWLDLTYN